MRQNVLEVFVRALNVLSAVAAAVQPSHQGDCCVMVTLADVWETDVCSSSAQTLL